MARVKVVAPDRILVPGKSNLDRCDNKVVSARYTALTFFPVAILEQFRRFANLYFLIVGCIMALGEYTDAFETAISPWTTLGPLAFVISISLLVEGSADYKRHKNDGDTNNAPSEVKIAFQKVRRMDIRQGQFVLLKNRNMVPADIVLLASSNDHGGAYIETSSIDGETNLKLRNSPRLPPSRGSAFDADSSPPSTGFDDGKYIAALVTEPPNPSVHTFSGKLTLPPFKTGESPIDIPLGADNVLLRGAVLRNTEWAIGVAFFTGTDTKLIQNSFETPSKFSVLDRLMNYTVLAILCIMVGCIAYLATQADESEPWPYLPNLPPPAWETSSNNWLQFFFLYVTLLNNFIPLSLYVTVEFITFCMLWFIYADREMYDDTTNTRAVARSTIVTDLGRVQYIFSDKTGTLTQNVMRFKRCSVDGMAFGAPIQKAAPGAQNDADDAPFLPLRQLLVGQFKSQRTAGLEGLGGSTSSDAAPVDKKLTFNAEMFLRVLSLCHTVVDRNGRGDEREKGPDGAPYGYAYQAESPDEGALVSAASTTYGFQVIGRDAAGIRLRVKEKEETWTILAVNKFDSDRKRMSILLRSPPELGSLPILFCKGADSAMLDPAIVSNMANMLGLQAHLGDFASEGLRTLVLGMRVLTEAECEEWLIVYKEAAVALKDRSELLTKAALQIERNIHIVGATAIEDKLQKGVPKTIATLGEAGIKLWVLTGDKRETAVEIGYSTHVLTPRMHLTQVPDNGKYHVRTQMMFAIDRQVRKGHLKKHMHWQRLAAIEEDGGSRRAVTVVPPKASDGPRALVIEGAALKHLLGDPEMEEILFSVASSCDAVIACRVSPQQKALLVKLVRYNVKPEPISLAIGDGANDVGMIQEAHVGIGISGKEGQQAVNASDFAIAQFRFLEELVLIHGRWNFFRLSTVVLYSFYKNALMAGILIVFASRTVYSGTPLFDEWLIAMLNFVAAAPIVALGLFDRCLSKEYVRSHPEVYKATRENELITFRTLLRWIALTFVHIFTLFF
ncbi:P4, P type ATPase, partial [Phaeodactylum tricornutum CCAP 1055/1]